MCVCMYVYVCVGVCVCTRVRLKKQNHLNRLLKTKVNNSTKKEWIILSFVEEHDIVLL